MTERRERGGALVELAVVLPLLLLLSLGVIEGAWAYSQQQAVRSLAREGARIAAHHTGDTPSLVAAVCDADDIVGTASLEATGIDSPYEHGARGFFRVQVTYQPITGFIPAFDSITIVEEVEFNSEVTMAELDSLGLTEPSWWSPGGGGATC
jgi:Flp pilus assembly protein TadG